MNATLVTCVALAMIFGTIHVIQLGSNRMQDMRDRASYDVNEMKSRIRASGEDIYLHRLNEAQEKYANKASYSVLEAKQLLTKEMWKELSVMKTIP
ncbi:MAG: formylglycine-generating enzyme family protein, partial [Gammaproteobacteria bacterium]|nr:formylglycine-generating enzyme family protein [Gammaproteobacteria bacterium]NIR94194.1 formylglycine-generating enzyme family protein [Gammaproteobacteria bacterium]